MEADKIVKRKVKIVAISDTHDKHKFINPEEFPQADIFIHAGDFTRMSRLKQFEKFRNFLDSLPYKHKIVIPGNHDFGLEDSYDKYLKISTIFKVRPKEMVIPAEQIEKLKKVCTFLCHEYVQIEGVRIFGSPYVNTDKEHLMGFGYCNQDGQKVWANLPKDIDILVTHNPPFGIHDNVIRPGLLQQKHVGCKALLQAVQTIQPPIHIFGHIHESAGESIIGKTHFYNVAYLDNEYKPKNKPIFIELQVQVNSDINI